MMIQLYLAFVMLVTFVLAIIWERSNVSNAMLKCILFIMSFGALFFLMQMNGYIVRVG